MSQFFAPGFADFVIYTSAIEHMHKDEGFKSLQECHKNHELEFHNVFELSEHARQRL